MKKICRTFVLIFLLIVNSIAISSCTFYDNVEKIGPETFDEFTKSLFVSLIGEDELTCNYYFINREDYGLENYEPSLYIPKESSILGKAMINLYYGKIKMYDYDLLNEDQKITYNLIVDLLDRINSKTTEMAYLDNNYLGTYLGYQAQLPILLAEYNFRTKLDVENYLKYLKLVPETFKGYYDFEVVKADHGYGMPDYVIDNVIEQCTTFTDSINSGESFMFTVINNKINSCTFLTESEKQSYIDQNNELVRTSLKEGYEYIKDNLANLYGRSVNDMGLAHYVTSDGYEIGKEYYTIIFQQAVGYDISCDEALTYIDNKLSNIRSELITLSSSLSEEEKQLINKILKNEYNIMEETPQDQINYYLEKIESDFPSLTTVPTIEFKYVDKSMENNYSPASYMKSPIDSTDGEVIYLNPCDIYEYDESGTVTGYDSTYLYTVIAHEGIPGHLYQHNYFKQKDVNIIRKVLSSSGYTEGWATYTENYSYNYLRDELGDDVVDYLILRSELTMAIESKLDLGIHYLGWTQEDLFNFMKNYYNVSTVEDVKTTYERLVEIPTNYQKYTFTYFKIVDMYDAVKEKLGNDFNAKDFHQTILDLGSIPLKYVEEAIEEKYNLSI